MASDYRSGGRLTLMSFWRNARRRKWLLFKVLVVTDWMPEDGE